MSKPKDGYVFWCSSCKFDHAGECQPVPGKASAQAMEALHDLADAYTKQPPGVYYYKGNMPACITAWLPQPSQNRPGTILPPNWVGPAPALPPGEYIDGSHMTLEPFDDAVYYCWDRYHAKKFAGQTTTANVDTTTGSVTVDYTD
jgi:hypothetical protein